MYIIFLARILTQVEVQEQFDGLFQTLSKISGVSENSTKISMLLFCLGNLCVGAKYSNNNSSQILGNDPRIKIQSNLSYNFT